MVQSCVFLALGILILWKQTSFFAVAMMLASLAVVVGGCAQYVYWLLQNRKKPLRERSPRQLLLGTAYITLGLVMLFFPRIPFYVLPILFACYTLMNGAIKLVDSILIIRNKAPELLFSLLPALFYLTFGILLLFSPLYHVRVVLVIIGIYCLLLGATYCADFIRMLIPTRKKEDLRRRIRVTLPIFFAAFVPHKVLTKLNQFLSSEPARKADEFGDIALKKTDEAPDLEIFIHVAKQGFCAIGHADICFEGEMIAYGNYDEASSTPLGTGDGVLIVTNKEQYIPYCLDFNHTTIFAFGLRLNEAQKQAVRDRIQEIKSQLVEWYPPYQAAVREHPGEAVDPKDYPDFSSGLSRTTKVNYYKFTGGKFKTYFVMSTNCVLLADSIICRAGTDILNLNGIISPGTFYDYLETEFRKPNSMVVTREVHTHDMYFPQAEEAAAAG